MKIKDIKEREILDSRGNPTVEVDVILEDGTIGRAEVPSGASTGEHEAVELRDENPGRYDGKGVLNAVMHVDQDIQEFLIGMDAEDQAAIDQKMITEDGTENKSRFGANAILAVSLAVADAQAKSEGKSLFRYLQKFNTSDHEPQLPTPMMNVINGGKHAPDGVDMQEFMVMPVGIESFAEKIRAGVEIFHSLKNILNKKGFVTLVGDEGGFAPGLEKNEDAITLIMQAVEAAGYKLDEQIKLALDPAVSELWNPEDKIYEFKKEGVRLTADELKNYWQEKVNKYPIYSLEDLLDEDAWEDWSDFMKNYNTAGIQIVGDDFLVTNMDRLKKAIEMKACNAILIKLNQIGTLTETVEAINLAHENGFNAIVSHRSGETENTFIADLVVAMGTGQIKTGSLSRSDRVAKYNQLLRIMEEM